MKTSFFSSVASLQLQGNLRINIQLQAGGSMLVSVLLSDDQVKDNAVQLIPPLVLKGDPSELDEGFFDALHTPLQQTSALITNLSAYEKAMGKAQKESKQEKDKAATMNREKDSKRKRFEEQMKKVEELEKQKKIGEAIGQLPDLKVFPEFEEEIKKKAQQLRSQHGTLSLFGETDTDASPEEPGTAEEQEAPAKEEESEEEDLTDPDEEDLDETDTFN